MDGIVYINLKNKYPFRVIFTEKIATKTLHVLNTNEMFEINPDKCSFYYENNPFYLFVSGFPKQLIPDKKVIDSICFFMDAMRIKQNDKKFFKLLLKTAKWFK